MSTQKLLLEYSDHTILKILVERPGEIADSFSLKIGLKLGIVHFVSEKKVQFLFNIKNISEDSDLKFEIHSAAEYQIIRGDKPSKVELIKYAGRYVLPSLWAVMIQVLSENMGNLGFQNIKLPFNESFTLNPDDVNFHENE